MPRFAATDWREEVHFRAEAAEDPVATPLPIPPEGWAEGVALHL
jgi:hypothetical protein